MNQAVVDWGVSNAARYVEDATRQDRRRLHESSAFGMESVLRGELAETWAECQQESWDGFGALPVTRDALLSMYVFLEALPIGFPRPTIGADPHGHLSAEWYRGPRRVLSVAVSADGLLHYAALLGPNNTCGVEAFYGDVPDSILSLVRRVFS